MLNTSSVIIKFTVLQVINELSLNLYIDLSLNGLDALYFRKEKIALLLGTGWPGRGDESIFRICRRLVCGLDAHHRFGFKQPRAVQCCQWGEGIAAG